MFELQNFRDMKTNSIISLMNTFISSDNSYESVCAMVSELGLEVRNVELL